MKAVLVIAAVFGFSATTAFAECAGHEKINASVAVDREFKTASITPPVDPVDAPSIVMKKGDRLPDAEPAAPAVAE